MKYKIGSRIIWMFDTVDRDGNINSQKFPKNEEYAISFQKQSQFFFYKLKILPFLHVAATV